jgi:transposase-like protein
MSQSVLTIPRLQNEEAAYEYVEARLWPEGPVCPHCGGTERISKMKGKSTRSGTYKCYVCRKQFTVKIGTIFEDSHVPFGSGFRRSISFVPQRRELVQTNSTGL